MKRDYFPVNLCPDCSKNFKGKVLAIMAMFMVSLAFSQRTLTIETVSSLNPWNVTVVNTDGSDFVWNATGAVNQSQTGRNVDFDFSANTSGQTISVSTSATPALFNRIIELNIDDIVESPPGSQIFFGQRVFSIDVTDLTNLQVLRLDNNSLISIDVSNNPDLNELSLNNNGSITSLDITTNTLLTDLRLERTALGSVQINNILNTLDSHGQVDGFLTFEGISTGNITADGIQAYINLVGKGWRIIPPQGFDRGDAPESFLTSLANNGPIHFYDEFNDDLKIGFLKDSDLNRPFTPGPGADGDDNDNVDDEDGVDESQFDSFFHTSTSYSVNVQLINSYGAESYLHGWIDFDRSGTFDADEYATVNVPANTNGIQTLVWDVTSSGADVEPGQTYARFRYTSTVGLTAADVGGIVSGGEVEDYTFEMLDGTDTDNDGVPDLNDFDDDNDGILDDVEDNGVEDRDTDGDGFPDRIDLDADGDGCFDVDENLYDNNGINQVGDQNPAVVDIEGRVTSLGPNGGYGTPVDADGNGTPDFQEAGAAASITTEPTDQELVIGVSTFSVVADADTYQWEESQDGGTNWVALSDAGDYAGTSTANLEVTNSDISKIDFRYRVVVSYIAYACDPTTTSVDVGYIVPDDFDGDGVYDIVDVDDDNDGILDTVEDNGVVDRDTDGDGNPDRVDLDADDDGCFDVEENLYDNNGINQVGNQNPAAVDLDGRVTSLGPNGGYEVPVDADGNGTPDFQEAGAPAVITAQPTDQIYILGGGANFSVTLDIDPLQGSFQWEESTDNGATWSPIIDGGDYAGATTADLVVSTPDLTKVFYIYRVVVSNATYACDPTVASAEATFVTPGDFDRDGVFDVVDVDDDNDGILDTVEDNGVVDRDTDGDGNPDRVDLDADDDGCFDVTEAGFTDDNGDGFLGDFPVTVDADGQVTSGSDGYTTPEDRDGNLVPDFQEAGAAAAISTQPTDQELVIGVNTFSVVATADTYQWEESQDGGSTWTALTDGGDYAGTTTADLSITNSDVSKANYRYRVSVSNIAYACDPTTVSVAVGFNALTDFDGDGVFDVADLDDDNDGILDTIEDNGLADRDTDGDGNPDRIDLDADDDGCFDVTEAGFTDENGDGYLGGTPVTVDADGQVTSGTDGYTAPEDRDINGTPDFQEAGAAAAISTQPTDQDLEPGTSATFSVVASADTYQWEESQDGGTTWVVLADGGNYAGATTADLTVSNLDLNFVGYQYRVSVSNIAYVCDPVTVSAVASFVQLDDFDQDGVPDIVDVDDDNDGILDTVEDNGVTDRDTDNDGNPDRIDLDADGDNCFDVTEAGFTDVNGDGFLGDATVEVDADGQVTSWTADGYTTPNDLDNNGTPDFQEAGTSGSVTTQPVDQDFILDGTAVFTADGLGGAFQWQVSTDGTNWNDLVEGGQYNGTTTNTLTISSLAIDNYFEFYRLVVSNIAFVCDDGAISDEASYNTIPDSDDDGVFDIVDVDDDNDGILDVVEGENTDTNLDGIPDRISIDADGDTCADVLEAGFEDPDGDGRLGTSPVNVDANGQVLGQGGYETPNDLDNNGVFDFQQAGAPSVISSQPSDVTVSLGENAVFEFNGSATYIQWELSTDDGQTWSALLNDDTYSGVDTERMTVKDPRGRLEGNQYRVVLRSPDYACDPVESLESNAVRLIFDTEVIPTGFSPNGDGVNDVFSIPGLIETPNFTMEVFDRWGNSVYKYDNEGSLSPTWWDGRSTGNMTLSKGERVPAGTYFYMIEFNDGDTSPAKGWVYVNY